MDAHVIRFILILAAILAVIIVMGILFTKNAKKREKRNLTKMGEDI